MDQNNKPNEQSITRLITMNLFVQFTMQNRDNKRK